MSRIYLTARDRIDINPQQSEGLTCDVTCHTDAPGGSSFALSTNPRTTAQAVIART